MRATGLPFFSSARVLSGAMGCQHAARTLVLIGIELLETIVKTYLTQAMPHYEVVLSVAITAIARKVIILDLKEVGSSSLLGIAAIILALSAGYYLMRRSHANPPAGGGKSTP